MLKFMVEIRFENVDSVRGAERLQGLEMKNTVERRQVPAPLPYYTPPADQRFALPQS